MPAMHRQLYLAACIVIGLSSSLYTGHCAAARPNTSAGPAEIKFDTNQLAANGFSGDVAQFFAREARFMPGVQQVNVSINAGHAQLRDVRFDGDGNMCFDRTLLTQLGLRTTDKQDSGACMKGPEFFQGMRVELKPGMSRVNLIVPDGAFDPSQREGSSQHGGRAAIFNYNIFAQQFQGNGAKQNYLQAQVEPGFNFDNWAFRSRGTLTRAQYQSGYRQQEAYAQRSVESIHSLFQAGSLSAVSDSYGGLPVIGAQLFSDDAQMGNAALIVPIQGIASTNAVIELRQRGQVVYRTVVAPGPYSLSQVGTLNSGVDIEVQVTEEDGHVSRFTISAPMSADRVNQPATYHVGVGRYRNDFNDAQSTHTPWLAFGDYSFNLLPDLRLSSGALLAQGYQGLSTQATLATKGSSWIGAGLRTSNASQRGLGHEFQIQGSTSLGGNVSGSLTWQRRSRNFATPDETFVRFDNQDYGSVFSQSLNASLSWSSLKWGAFSYNMAHTRDAYGAYTSHTLTTSRKIGRANANLTLQKGGHHRDAAYLSLSMPLGHDSLSARFYRNEGRSNSLAATYMGRPRADLNYQIDAAKTGDTTRLTTSTQMRTAYAQVSAGLSQTGQGSRALYGSAMGSMVLTGDGTFATGSGRVGDTFAVLKVPELTGLRMSAQGGSVKTSVFGTALVPNVYPYRNTRLPLSFRLDTTAFDMNLARGAVMTQTIGAKQMRQLMLQVRNSDGSFPTLGTSVINEEGDFMGTVVGEGNLILTNEDIGKPVYLETSGKPRCKVDYQAPEKFNPEIPYEEAAATCA
jgi:outer membrane usher protein